MNVRLWLNTHQAAEHTGHHVDTIRKALEADELHGHQRVKNGRWRVHIDCLDAWCGGLKCEHQEKAA